MARQVEEFEIDDVRYSASQYSAGKAIRLLTKIIKMIGKPVGILTGTGLDAEANPDLIGAALQALASAVEPEEVEKMAREILEGTLVFTADGKNRQIVFDTDFAGRIGHLFKVLQRILTFQYADFLGGLAAVTPALAAKGKAAGRIKAL